MFIIVNANYAKFQKSLIVEQFQGNYLNDMIIKTSSLFENLLFQMFPVHTKTQSLLFQKAPFSSRISSVHGRPNRIFKFLPRSVDGTLTLKKKIETK